MKHLSLLPICLILALAAPAVGAETLSGKVVGISDGDTLTLLVDKTQHKIRLYGIDCPEKGQPFGTKAKKSTSAQCFGKEVVVEVAGKDRYGRTIGIVLLLDGTIVNHEIVRAGLAWWYRKYAEDNETLEDLEKEARKAKRGLWADENPIPPWEWRKRKKSV